MSKDCLQLITQGHRLVLVRRLRQIAAEPAKSYVVEKHCHKRLGYVMSDHDVLIDCIPEASVIRAVLVVPDPWQASKKHGVKQRMNNVPDEQDDRKHAACFGNRLQIYLISRERMPIATECGGHTDMNA